MFDFIQAFSIIAVVTSLIALASLALYGLACGIAKAFTFDWRGWLRENL